MQNYKAKTLTQFVAGIFGGTILGLFGFSKLVSVAKCDTDGNACDCFCCNVFGMRGYESCGTIGAWSGILIGVILAILIFSLFKITHYQKVTVSLFLITFIVQFFTQA